MNTSTLDFSFNSPLSEENAYLLDEIATELRPEYIDFISKLNYKYKNDVLWLMTDISNRNTLNCNLFENICRLELIKRSNKLKIKSIIADNPYLYKSIKKNYKDSFEVINKSKYLRTFFKIVYNNIKHFSYLIITYFLRYFSSFFNKKQTPTLNNKPIVLVETIVYRNSFNNGKFTDRHFPEILNYLNKNITSSVLFLPYYYKIYNIISLFKNLNNAKQNFLIPEDFLCFNDYFKSIFYFLKSFKSFKDIRFQNIDVTDLVIYSYYNNLINGGPAEGHLRKKLFYRLKKKKIEISRYILWFENQPINKGVIMGLNKYYPKTKTIGYVGFFNSHNALGLYPTVQEFKFKLLPNEIAVMGKKYIEDIKVFCPKQKVILLPAFRFQNLLKPFLEKKSSKIFTVLLALPIFSIDYVNIINLFSLIKNTIEFDIIIKTHPGSNQKKLYQLLYKKKLNSFVSPNNMYQCLNKSDLVITSGSSSAIESIFLKKPTIILSNRISLIKNPIPQKIPKEFYSICYDKNDLINKIKFYKKNKNKISNNYSKLNIEDFIYKNNKSNMDSVFGID